MYSLYFLSIVPFMLETSTAFSASIMSRASPPVPHNHTTKLVPYTYDLLPIGQVKPQGWFNDQLQLQGHGLAGNLFTFYRYVKDSTWLGGTEEYSELHESAPYWYNANVPLAYVLNDDRLIEQSNTFLNYVLDHQAEDGWLGPETTRQTRGLWARCLLLQGMMNHAIADPKQEDKIVSAIHKYVVLANSMLKDNFTGYIQQPGDNFDPFGFGVVRAHELSTTLQWLYDEHPRGKEQLIWETMDLMWQGAIKAKRDWSTFFVDGEFPTGAEPIGAKAKTNFEHGVNMAQGLRYMAQQYRMSKDERLVGQTRDAVNMTFKYQGSSAGSIVADEYVGGLSPQRGSELCMAVETTFSLSYLYRLIGDNSFADRAELAAFNAFPAALSPDWWSHQYVTQSNQPWSKNLTGKPFFNVVSYGNVYGLEPNFPCCTVNHGQALPKFAMTSFVSTADSGLLHMHLIPASVSTTIDGKRVSILCDTAYPFGSTLKYTIDTPVSFPFYVRIPSWVLPTSTIKINLGTAQPLTSAPDTNLQKVLIPKGHTTVEITLDASIRVVPRRNNTVSIYHGALLYALDIKYNTTSHSPLSWQTTLPLPQNTTHPSSQDHTLLPLSPWNLALDPSQLFFNTSLPNGSSQLHNPVFERGGPPTAIYAAAQMIEWPETRGTADLPPSTVKGIGEPFWAKLVPFGSAKIHMAELPVVTLPKLER